MTTIFNNLLALMILMPIISNAQKIPCENGMAGEYPCSNIDLLGHLTTDDLLAEEHQGILLNDIWGWTDPDTGKEYAIIGMANGTSFVDISDPENPLMLGILPEHHLAESHKFSGKEEHDGAKSIWRDIKVYQNHAFIVSEDVGHGMQVFDLTDLRDVVDTPTEFMEAGHYSGISNAHNIVINEETGFAYAVGGTGSAVCGEGGLHIINIQDPKNPVYEACYDFDGYTHDAQCVIYNGPDLDYQGKEICFNSNEDTITIVDVDDKDNIEEVSRTGYEGARYTHQGWLTEDQKFFLSNDELDEEYNGVNTTTFIWDVQDLDNPVLIGKYIHGTKAIDHNLYIVGNKAYESNYTSGLRVLDITDISDASLNLSGFFDTYPVNNNVEFYGTWSNYPFFESGVIAVSDITNGLFLLKLSDVSETVILTQPQDIDGCVGQHYDMSVEASGDDLSFRWQIDTGSGFEDITDFANYNNTYSANLHIHEVVLDQIDTKFRCKITDSSNTTLFSDEFTLNVTSAPIVDFDYTYEENLVHFKNLTLYGKRYQWDFGDGSRKYYGLEIEHNYDKEIQEYDVLLTSDNDCGTNEITKPVTFVITDIIDELNSSDINIYPVPANGELNIIDSNNKFDSINIYDTSGHLLNTYQLSGIETNVNIKALNKGLYLLELVNKSGNNVIRKIIIE